ncbi:MAG: carbohydrate ABC transporter permease [Oscillospiraceae bacterium]|jgi:putative aldouronate transport system permease protein|nr:carbohydrate ABC transporter permease [Oscillospiraceae bacterium]
MEAIIQKRKSKLVPRTYGDKIFDCINLFVWALILVMIIYPLWYVLIASVSSAEAIFGGQLTFWPIDFSLIGYEAVFANDLLMRSYLNSIFYTVAGTSLSVAVTMMAAYALSRKFEGRKFITFYFLFTMFFTGGLIPQFLMNRQLGLYNTVTLMIIINAVSVWNLMIARTFITTSIPDELYEAAILDGAGHFTYFFKIIVPLSKTIIAVLFIYYGVARWNDFFTALVYIRDDSLLPLQTVLRRIIATAQAGSSLDSFMGFFGDGRAISDAIRRAEVVKYCCIVVSTAPVIALYIYMQKFFIQGITIGSLKG